MKTFRILISSILICICLPGILHAQDVYKTPSGNRYHLANCRMVKNVSERISLNQAAHLGLTPCKICNPSFMPLIQSQKSTSGTSATVQCKGMTKAGNRCRHRTSIGNGYCFQHQPG